MLTNADKDKYKQEVAEILKELNINYSLTYNKILSLLSNKYNINISKSELSKIKDKKRSFAQKRNQAFLIKLHSALSDLYDKINNKYPPDVTPEASPIKFACIQNIVFKDNKKYICLFLCSILFMSISIVVLSLLTDVWNNPNLIINLSDSYVTWLGAVIFAIINVVILYIYNLMSYVIAKTNTQKFILRIKKWRITTLLFSLFLSLTIHKTFLSDNLWHWTETDAGKHWSILGWYHIIIVAIQSWIFINFLLYIFAFGKVLIKLNNKKYFFYIVDEKILKKIYKIFNFFKIIVIMYGIYVLIFFMTFLRYLIIIGNSYLWMWYELLTLFIFYIFIVGTGYAFGHYRHFYKLYNKIEKYFMIDMQKYYFIFEKNVNINKKIKPILEKIIISLLIILFFLFVVSLFFLIKM